MTKLQLKFSTFLYFTLLIICPFFIGHYQLHSLGLVDSAKEKNQHSLRLGSDTKDKKGYDSEHIKEYMKHIPKEHINFEPPRKDEVSTNSALYFNESALAHKWLDGLHGLEIGASSHNGFGLDSYNVDFTVDPTIFHREQVKLAGAYRRVDIVAPGNVLPIPDSAVDFVLSSHAIEHFHDPIGAMLEWIRVVRPGGFVYTVAPHKERTFDKDRNRTDLAELLERHRNPIDPKEDDHHHWNVWILEDFLEMCEFMKWKVVDSLDVDDKVGNGFTVVIQVPEHKKEYMKHIPKEHINFEPPQKDEVSTNSALYFNESALAHKWLDGLHGLEIGASSHNGFGLDSYNVDFTVDPTVYHREQIKLAGAYRRVDIVAPGNVLPIPDSAVDFVLSSHAIEHFHDPIGAMLEWIRVVRPGGFVYTVAPHKERTFDKDRNRTDLAELLERHRKPIDPQEDDHRHWNVWILEDFLEMCEFMKWKVVDSLDVDDKVGNGFTVVIQVPE